MTAQFRLNPDELDRIAAELDAVHAGDCRQAVSGLRRVNEAIAGAWIGGSSQAFDALHAGWITRLELIGQDLSKVAVFLRAAADEYRKRDAERLAAMFVPHAGRGTPGLSPRASATGRYMDGTRTDGITNRDIVTWLMARYGTNQAGHLAAAWSADPVFTAALRSLEPGYSIAIPNDPGSRVYCARDAKTGLIIFETVNARGQRVPADLTLLQGRGPFEIRDSRGTLLRDPLTGYGGAYNGGLITGYLLNTTNPTPITWQPVYDYSKQPPAFTGQWRETQVGLGVTVNDLTLTNIIDPVARGAFVRGLVGTTVELTVKRAVSLGILSASALGPAGLLTGNVVFAIVAIDSAGNVTGNVIYSNTQTGQFWNDPAWTMRPAQPNQPPAVGAQPPPWRNPNGPNYSAPPGMPSR